MPLHNEFARAVLAALPRFLTRLTLSFAGCRIGPSFLVALPNREPILFTPFCIDLLSNSPEPQPLPAFPAVLTQLTLNFSGCGIDASGARVLAAALPASLTLLSLNFRNCPIGAQKGSFDCEGIGMHASRRG